MFIARGSTEQERTPSGVRSDLVGTGYKHGTPSGVRATLAGPVL
jgi:hypothetical protein